MEAIEAWKKIIDQLDENPQEYHTVPLRKTVIPVWFTATTDGSKISISIAKTNRPSSNLKIDRYLTWNIFKKVYPIYLRREKGEKVSQEVISITVNSVYYYALIKALVTH